MRSEGAVRDSKRLRAAPRAGRLRMHVTPVNPPTNCLRCGVCCFSKLETFVRVTGDDWTRLGAAAGRVAHFDGHCAYMKMADHHCAALELRRTPGGAAEFFCTVYANRPQVCRNLARGSPQCAGERAAKRERVDHLRQGFGGQAGLNEGCHREPGSSDRGDL